MTSELRTSNRARPGLRVLLLVLTIAGIAAPVASSLRAAHAEEAVRAVAVEGTAFRITLADGRTLAGQGLVGVTLTMADSNGGQVPVRIDAVQPDPKDRSGEITLYSFSIADAATGERRNLCEPDPDGERWGFPVAQEGAAGAFGITCTSGALGKCVRFGYKPWHAARDGVAMRDLYDSCVHMVRADYCGDGKGYTRNGTTIDLYDRFGIQKDEPLPGMSFEAGWGPDGAVCVARTRIPEVATLNDVLAACPRLRQAPSGADCTEASAKGALLFNKSF